MINSCQPIESAPSDYTGQDRLSGCRLTNRTVTYTNGSTSYTASTSNWVYNTHNALIQFSNPQALSPYPAHIDFNYDTNNYLISTVETYVYSGIAGFISATVITNYEYANGRLSKAITGNQVTTYEYNQAGELTKIVNNPGLYGDTEIDVFSADKLTDHFIITYDTRTEIRPYQLEDGQIIRQYARDRRYYTGYQYDKESRPIKIERIDSSTVGEYYTYAYTSGKAYFEAIPLPKGWPSVTRKKFVYETLLSGSPVTPTGLPTSWTRYSTTRPNSLELFKNIVKEYSHIKNGWSYPVRTEYVTTVYTSFNETVGTPSRITETYTYEGCR
jgi:YD repeat-containing protein